ncbi:hypothetical protein [Winogradskyella sp.]|jgi:hypothetical protein|uniref:hypothetical protein n=1 Tax=Winogradskyella sp. TaxID=1883156 RepID=UPI0025E9792C|nr:hypothetical protein [Winogradskyella sp.]MCT4631063.1 hypothetical protein [Winogradskyella sp.]
MKLKSLIIATILTTATLTKITAQNTNDLIGKWETSYNDKGKNYIVVYEFKKEDKTVKAYTVLIKDEKGEQLEDNSLVLSKIEFKNKKGTCIYSLEYEGELYEIKSKLNLKDNNTLVLSYSYYGFSDTETWKRIKS